MGGAHDLGGRTRQHVKPAEHRSMFFFPGPENWRVRGIHRAGRPAHAGRDRVLRFSLASSRASRVHGPHGKGPWLRSHSKPKCQQNHSCHSMCVETV